MKKTFKILLSTLCLCPLLLCACQSNEYYKITAISSSSALGSVSGYSTDKVLEGSTITLTARENYPYTNPLIGWVKDNEYLVKIAGIKENATDTTLSLTASEDTSGKYTAVFAEDLSSMMYAYVSQTSFAIDDVTLEKADYSYELSYAIMSAGSDSFLPFEDEIGEDINTNILYFGGLGQSYVFKFKAEISLSINGTDGTTKIVETITNSNLISKDNFLDSLDFEFDADGSNAKFSLSLAKFSTQLKDFLQALPAEE